MKHIILEAQARATVGNSVRKIRKEGFIPGVLYGKGIPPVNIQFQYNIFLKLFKETGKTTVIDVNVNNNSYPCLIQDIDLHPVSENLRHVDFLVVDLKQKTTASVPIEFVGEPDKSSGGVLMKLIDELEVEALPEQIPHSIIVDLSQLKEIGDTLHISDIKGSKEFSILGTPETLIAQLTEESPDEEPAENPQPVSQTETPQSE